MNYNLLVKTVKNIPFPVSYRPDCCVPCPFLQLHNQTVPGAQGRGWLLLWSQKLSRRKLQDRKTNHCPGLEQNPFRLPVVKLRKQVRACKKLQRGKREMAYFLIVHKPIWLERSVPSWPEQREEAFQVTLRPLWHTSFL